MKRCRNFDKKAEFKSFLERLRESGKRLTRQRREIVFEVLRFQRPFSADDLFEVLRKKNIDLATVYRSLTMFSESGILDTVDFSDGTLRYEYLPAGEAHHHHIICTDCRSIESIDICYLQEQENQIKKLGYSNIFHKLEFFGLCRVCAS